MVDRYTGYQSLSLNAPALRERLEFVDPPLEVKPLHALVPKNRAEGEALAASLDRGLCTLRRSDRLDAQGDTSPAELAGEPAPSSRFPLPRVFVTRHCRARGDRIFTPKL